MSDKNHSIEMLKNGTVKYTAIDVKEEWVRMYGDTAIYNGLANTKMTVNGQDQSGDYRVTIVWAKLNGEWKRLSFQATHVMSQESDTHRAQLSNHRRKVSRDFDGGGEFWLSRGDVVILQEHSIGVSCTDRNESFYRIIESSLGNLTGAEQEHVNQSSV